MEKPSRKQSSTNTAAAKKNATPKTTIKGTISTSSDNRKTKNQLIEELSKSKRITTKLEKKLQRLQATAESQYRNLFTSIRDVIIVADKERNIIDANQPALREQFGYELEDIKGKQTSILYASEEAFKQTGKEVFNLEGKVMGKTFEVDFRKKDGQVFPSEMSALKLIDNAGKIIGNFGIIRDITERKRAEDVHMKSEKFLSDILNSVQDGISILDSEFKIVRTNMAMEKWYSHQMPIVGKKCYAAYHGAGSVCDPCPSVRSLKNKKPAVDVVPYDTPEGQKGWLELYTFPLMEENSTEPSGVIEFVRDITKRRQAEDLVKKSLKEKEILLREVHHRVKNNMAVISSLLSLQSGYINAKKPIDEILMESQNRIRSMALVHEKLYKSEDFVHINMQEYVESLARSIKDTFSVKNDVVMMIEVQEVILDIDTLIPCGLIINEILTNAFKHAFDEISNPEISIGIVKVDGDEASLTIRDNGVGLPEGFDIKKSKGLGLEIVHTLANQLYGKLEIVSNNGTIFKLTFPEKYEQVGNSPDNC